MATLAQKIDAERHMRELLDDGDLPAPDRVEYGYTCIRLFWHETKTVVVVDIDEPHDGGAGDSGVAEDAASPDWKSAS